MQRCALLSLNAQLSANFQLGVLLSLKEDEVWYLKVFMRMNFNCTLCVYVVCRYMLRQQPFRRLADQCIVKVLQNVFVARESEMWALREVSDAASLLPMCNVTIETSGPSCRPLAFRRSRATVVIAHVCTAQTCRYPIDTKTLDGLHGVFLCC
jgi:hypothetical protein